MDPMNTVAAATGLAPALTKVADKTLDGIGSLLGAICKPAAEELGLLLRERVSAFREHNLDSIREKTEAKIKELGVEASGDANPLLLKSVIEDASWMSDEVVHGMWAGLIAGAAGGPAAADDSLIYSDTIKRLTAFQARFVKHVYSDPRLCSANVLQSPPKGGFLAAANPLIYPLAEVLSLYPADLSKFVPIATSHAQLLKDSVHHSLAISRFIPQFEALQGLGLIYELTSDDERIKVIPTWKGLDFYMRCEGYKIYPVEAFLITMRHWCTLRGIDPETYHPSMTSAPTLHPNA